MTKAEMIAQEIGSRFWTFECELIEDLEELGYEVEEICGEYVAISDNDENEYILYLGHANRTMWVERVRAM